MHAKYVRKCEMKEGRRMGRKQGQSEGERKRSGRVVGLPTESLQTSACTQKACQIGKGGLSATK